MSQFPEVFGVIRTRPSGGLCLQICTAQYIRRGPGGISDYHVIQNASSRELRRVEERVETSYDHNINSLSLLRYKHPDTGQVQEVMYWYLPFQLFQEDDSIPLLDFQYRSWLPLQYTPFPFLFDPIQARHIIERIQHVKLQEIRRLEDTNAESDYISIHDRFDSMMEYSDERGIYPNHWRLERYQGRRLRDLRNASPLHREPVVRVVEVPVERVVVERHVQALPKSVGDVLLANARMGQETCPIAAIPLQECSKICITSCFHIFDTQSLSRWREDHTTCPVCRASIENVVSEE